jgi:uncharacterized protein DUF4411
MSSRRSASQLKYIADTSSLLELVAKRDAPTRVRQITRIAKAGRLRVPDRVARELGRKADKLKSWVARNPSIVLASTNENVGELVRVSQTYPHHLGTKTGAADPIIVAMGVFFERSNWVILTDDVGIQTVCVLENLTYVSSRVFLRLEQL